MQAVWHSSVKWTILTLFNETLQQEQEQEQELYQIAYNYQGALLGAAGE